MLGEREGRVGGKERGGEGWVDGGGGREQRTIEDRSRRRCSCLTAEADSRRDAH